MALYSFMWSDGKDVWVNVFSNKEEAKEERRRLRESKYEVSPIRWDKSLFVLYIGERTAFVENLQRK